MKNLFTIIIIYCRLFLNCCYLFIMCFLCQATGLIFNPMLSAVSCLEIVNVWLNCYVDEKHRNIMIRVDMERHTSLKLSMFLIYYKD